MISQREIVNMKLVIRWGCQASKTLPRPRTQLWSPLLQPLFLICAHCTLCTTLCTMYTEHISVKREAKSNFTIIINTRSQPWSLSCSEVNSCFKSNSDFGHCCNHPPGGFPPFQKIMNFSTHFFRNTTL